MDYRLVPAPVILIWSLATKHTFFTKNETNFKLSFDTTPLHFTFTFLLFLHSFLTCWAGFINQLPDYVQWR